MEAAGKHKQEDGESKCKAAPTCAGPIPLPWEYADVQLRLQEFRDILRRAVTRSHIAPMDDLVTFSMYVSWHDLRMDDLSLVRRLLQNIECLLFAKRPALLNHVYPHSQPSCHPVPACRLVFQLLQRNSFPAQLFQMLLRDVYHLIVQLPAEGIRLLLGLRRQTDHVSNSDLDAYLNRQLGVLLLRGPWTRIASSKNLEDIQPSVKSFPTAGAAYAYAYGRHLVPSCRYGPKSKLWGLLGQFLTREVLVHFYSNPALFQNLSFDPDLLRVRPFPDLLPLSEVFTTTFDLLRVHRQLEKVKSFLAEQTEARQKLLWQYSLPPSFAQLYSFLLPYNFDRWSCTPCVPQAALRHDAWRINTASNVPGQVAGGKRKRSCSPMVEEAPSPGGLDVAQSSPTLPAFGSISKRRASTPAADSPEARNPGQAGASSSLHQGMIKERRGSAHSGLASPVTHGSEPGIQQGKKDFALCLTGTLNTQRLDQIRSDKDMGQAVDNLLFGLFFAPNMNVLLTPGSLHPRTRDIEAIWFPVNDAVVPHSFIFYLADLDQYWVYEPEGGVPPELCTQYIRRFPLPRTVDEEAVARFRARANSDHRSMPSRVRHPVQKQGPKPGEGQLDGQGQGHLHEQEQGQGQNAQAWNGTAGHPDYYFGRLGQQPGDCCYEEGHGSLAEGPGKAYLHMTHNYEEMMLSTPLPPPLLLHQDDNASRLPDNPGELAPNYFQPSGMDHQGDFTEGTWGQAPPPIWPSASNDPQFPDVPPVAHGMDFLAGNEEASQGAMPPAHVLGDAQFDWMAVLPPLPPLPSAPYDLNMDADSNMCSYFQLEPTDYK